MKCNNRFSVKDLFMNPKLANVFPQFVKDNQLEVVVERWVLDYLKGVLNGRITGSGELMVSGKHKAVLRRVRDLKDIIEDFFDNMPDIVKNLRKDTKIYTGYVSTKEIENITDPREKAKLMSAVLENMAYNPDIISGKGTQSSGFVKRQNAWMKQVGYKEKMQ